MDGVVSDESKVLMCTQRLANPPHATMQMLLSTTNITPDHATTGAALVAGEVAVAGYARQNVSGWSAPALDGSFRAVASAIPVTFLNTSGADTATIYTWAFIDTTTGHIVMAGRFSAPFVLSATVGSYTVTPFWRDTGV